MLKYFNLFLKLCIIFFGFLFFNNTIFAQKKDNFLRRHETTVLYYPVSLLSLEFKTLDFGFEYAVTSNTFLQNSAKETWFNKQLSTFTINVRAGLLANDMYSEDINTKGRGWSTRLQIRKYSTELTYKNGTKRELRGFYSAPEIYFSTQSYHKDMKFLNSNIQAEDSIICLLLENAESDYFHHKKTNIGGYIKFGIRQNVKRLVLDYYIGIGNKFVFKEKIEREEKIGIVPYDSYYCMFKCGFGLDFVTCFLETGIGIGF